MNHERTEKQKPVPKLTMIVRVFGNHVPVKVRFSLSHESVAELALFCTCRPVVLCAYISPYEF